MDSLRSKIRKWYTTIKGSKRLTIIAILLLIAAIPTTVILVRQVRDVRQRADVYPATITVTPLNAKAGEMISVSWTYQNGVAVTATPTTTQPTPTTQQGNPTVTPVSFTLPAVQNLTANKNGSSCSDVVLTWDPPSGITGNYTYTLIRTVQGNPEINKTIENIAYPYYTDTGLPNGSGVRTTVVYQVRVRQGNNQSSLSNSAQMVLQCPTAFHFPQLVSKAYAQDTSGETTTSTATPTLTPIPPVTGAETLQLINLDGGSKGPQMYLNCLQAISVNQPPVAAPATGSCSYPLVTTLPKGSYVIRMLAADGTTILGQSATISISPTPYIFASPNPCILNAQGLCTSTITWTGQGATDIQIRIKETDNALFAAGDYGSQAAPWISGNGVTFDLYSGTTLLTSVFVKGVNANKITASPNPCALDTQGLCTSTIAWNAQGMPDVRVKIKENPDALFAQGDIGIAQAPWIPASGVTFQLYSGTTLLDTATAAGVLATDPRAPTPTPTRRPLPTQAATTTPIPATTTQMPTSTPTTAVVPTATPAADNSQNNYQYLYDPNN